MRLLRRSVDVHTAHSQPMRGTPTDVPVPRKVIFKGGWSPSDRRAHRRLTRRQGEDAGTVGGESHRVLEVGGEAAVGGDRRPAVGSDFDVGRAEAEDWFDGQHVADFQTWSPARGTVVEDVRVFVQVAADAVAAVLADDCD